MFFLDNNKTIAVEQEEEEEKNIKLQKIRRIDFSFKREVFFIVAGALMAAIVMAIPMTFLYVGIGSGYYLTWVVFGHIVRGVYSSISSTIIIAGITTAVVILIIVFLIKWNSRLGREIKIRTKELDESNKQLVLANKKLESANEQLKVHDNMQNEFINIAAHELRTPIQPILGLSEVIQSKIKDAELGELQGVVIRNAKRLQRLADDILDVTRIESNSLNLKKEQFDINKKILNVIKAVEKQVSNSDKLKILFKEPTEAVLVDADKVRIYQVITNLLNNAIKFKGETISVSTKVTQQQKDKNKEKEGRYYSDCDDDRSTRQVIVSIKDSGIGIDPEIQPRLFTKFATKSQTGGTGLGLFISKSIIEKHDGRIWAENSADGKGATFSFSLPIK